MARLRPLSDGGCAWDLRAQKKAAQAAGLGGEKSPGAFPGLLLALLRLGRVGDGAFGQHAHQMGAVGGAAVQVCDHAIGWQGKPVQRIGGEIG